MIKKRKLSQGEIFGVALLFVVIIIGFLVYVKIKSVSGFENENLKQEGQYKILAEGTLNTLMKGSTGCFVEHNRDSLKDVINFCLENDVYPSYDPEIECDDGFHDACAYAIQLINESLFYLYNNTESSKGLANVPFEMHMDLPSNQNTFLSNKTFTNFDHFMYRNVVINESNRMRYGYKRAPSGLISWSTSDRNIQLELYLYYR